jgi:hypothetical protein
LPALVLVVYAALLAGVTVSYPALSALAAGLLGTLALIGWLRVRAVTPVA